MKIRLLMCVIFVGIVFVTGCIGEKATNSNTSIDSQTPDLIVKQSDVPGLGLWDFKFISIPKSSSYNYTAQQQGNVEETRDKKVPVGNRYVGQVSTWIDHQTQREVGVVVKNFDADSGFKEFFDSLLIRCDETTKAGKWKNSENVLDAGCGSPFGNNSFDNYIIYQDAPDMKTVGLDFSQRNYFVQITVVDKKEKSLDEAIRIAKIIKSRLD
ncbi:MAG: hypothetical protein O8C64_13025 [Candidatus Methanoperedens sp.]|nr:hypothetical protein [Candidatus Methanoperedens sp.]MCZ7403949.1 hypothetical protein [Candidatus Methanoperedens sp.]